MKSKNVKKECCILKNCKVIVYLVIFVLLFIIAIFCDTFWRTNFYNFFSNIFSNWDYGGVLSAVQIGVAAFTITLVSFTSSHNNKTYYNLETKDVLKLKYNFTLSIYWLTLFELVLSVMSVIFYYLQYYFTISLLLGFTLMLCFIYTVQTLPIIMKSNKALESLLKQNVKKIKNFEDETFNKLLFNYVVEKGFDKTYTFLPKTGDKKTLFEQILRNSIDSMRNYKKYQDIPSLKLELSSIVSRNLENIKIIFNEDSEIFKDDQNYKCLTIFIAQLFYFIQDRKNQLDEQTLERADNTLSSLFACLLYDKDNKMAKSIFEAFEFILKWTIEDENMWFINLVKLEFSKYYFTFTDKYWMKKLFAEISILLYYYCEQEKLINNDFKEKLKQFLIDKYQINAKDYSHSWSALMNDYIGNFNLKLSDLVNGFNLENWEFVPYNKSKFCILHQTQVHSWWLNCYLCTIKIFDEFDKEDFNQLSDKEKSNFICVVTSLFKTDSSTFVPPKNFNEFVNFYKIQDNYGENYFDSQISFIKDLFEVKNDYKKSIEEDFTKKNNNEYLSELSNYLENEISLEFKKSKAYDPDLKIPDKNIPKGFYVLEEMFDLENSKYAYKDQIIRSFSNEFKKNIEEKFNGDFLSFDEHNIKKTLDKIEQIKPEYSTQKGMAGLSRFKIFSSEELEKWKEFDSKIEDCSKDLVVPHYVYANKNGIKFNFDITIFELNKLSEADVQRVLDDYKKDNGVYFYKGIQFEYDELRILLHKKLFTLKVYIKFESFVDLKNARFVDVWGYFSRKKERENQ